MNFAELKNNLKNKVESIYLIYGSDIFLMQKAVEMITKAAGVIDETLDISRLDEKSTADSIIAECRTVSFFGGKRVVVVKPFTSEQNNNTLKKYLNNPDENTVLALVSDAEVKIKNIQSVNCNPMSPDILTRLIANQLNTSNKKITADGARLLCEYCGDNYSKIDNEINKLINFYNDKELLSVDEINQIVIKPLEFQIFELSKAMCSGNLVQSELILKTLQDRGEDDYAIFGNLVSAFRRLYYSLSTRAQNDKVANVLGCSPFAITYARRDNPHLATKIVQLYSYAIDLEFKIKSGSITTDSAITLLTMATTVR